MFEAPDVLPQQLEPDRLSPEQSAIALGLQRYYQFVCVGPTPKRMQMLLDELQRRAAAGSAS